MPRLRDDEEERGMLCLRDDEEERGMPCLRDDEGVRLTPRLRDGGSRERNESVVLNAERDSG